MPKLAKELSALAIKNIKHSGKNNNPERYAVGSVPGLLLQVTPNNAKSWLLRTTIAGRRQFLGFGPYPEVSLKDARERAAAEKQKVRTGIDPVVDRKVKKAALKAASLRGKTFQQVTSEFLDTKLTDKSQKHRAQWRATLETYALPEMGSILVDDITSSDILRVLQPIWEKKTETASRLRGRIESVLNYAAAKGYRQNSDNPARWNGHLKEILPAPGKIQKTVHHPAVQLKDLPQWYTTLRKSQSIGAMALEFLTLTACRSGEVRGAVWDEINIGDKIWVIPADRMKMRKEHRVPLCSRAIEILEQVPHFEGSTHIFPAVRGGALSDMTLSKHMHGMHEREIKAGCPGWVDGKSKRPAVAHGLRSSFRDWAGEKTDYPREIIELCLAHDIMGSVERAYMRTDILEKRREIMSAWEKFLRGN
ncbi:MAG TPA: integrase arm-type DNA-binding domain-containing protein [Rickettsiales bacterium]|nr:integrase arm-type DNA-binding domain-containing protein [Rickettsiales bacterium]